MNLSSLPARVLWTLFVASASVIVGCNEDTPPVEEQTSCNVPAKVGAYAGTTLGGFADARRDIARFSAINDIALGPDGSVFIADIGNRRIRRIDPSGNVTTVAGDGTEGYTNGAGTASKFGTMSAIAVSGNGTVFIADSYTPPAEPTSTRIRILTTSGQVEDLVGGTNGFVNGVGTNVKFQGISALAIGPEGDLFVADQGNHAIRRVSTTGVVSTVAGTGIAGFVNGPVASAQFSSPRGLAVGKDGTIYVADRENRRIRVISTSGNVTTLSGTGAAGSADGPGASATFDGLEGIAIDKDGFLVVADRNNFKLRRVTLDGTTSTFAGTGASGLVDGPRASAQFTGPIRLFQVIDGRIFVADAVSPIVRVIECE
jgi:sugar lactone lactonase YvrE